MLFRPGSNNNNPEPGEHLPEITPGRCVHEMVDTASCRDCVDACPHGAWILDEDALALDTVACSGCGLCSAACRPNAIDLEFVLSQKSWKNLKVAAFSCEYASPGKAAGDIPCIHAIGLQDILTLYRNNTKHYFIHASDCSRCSLTPTETFEHRVEKLNNTLEASNHKPIRIIRLTADSWQQFLQDTDDKEEQKQIQRRGFFKGIAREIDKRSHIEGQEEGDEQHLPPGMLLPEQNDESVWPYLPVIDAERCNGCDACIKVCPNHALTIGEGENQKASYEMNAALCSGCRLCVDMCDADAISVGQWEAQDTKSVPLLRKDCKACGVTFHTLQGQSMDDSGLCHVCMQNNQYKNLYQVLS